MQGVRAIAEFIEPDPDARRRLMAYAEHTISTFMREPGIWQQIAAVAGVLIREGTIEGDHPLLAGDKVWRVLPSQRKLIALDGTPGAWGIGGEG